MKISAYLKKIIDNLSYKQKDDIFRYLWAENITGDVRSRASDRNIELTDDEVDTIAERYVNGRYDCNLCFWDNLDNLIDELHDS